MHPRKLLFWLLVSSFSLLAFADNPPAPAFVTQEPTELGADFVKKWKVSRVLRESDKIERTWVVSDKSLIFNPSYKRGGKWEVRFGTKNFQAATQESVSPNFRLKDLQSKGKDGLFLTLENGSGKTYSLQSLD